MIEKTNDFLIGIAIGVRFRANFSIEDQLGKIVDTILYSKNSSFSPVIFPKVRNTIGSKILFNEITEDKIHIDNSNIILEINLHSNNIFKKDNINDIISSFEVEIINKIMNEFKIKEIIRVGFIKRYIYQVNTLASSFVQKTIGNTIDGINDINLSFSKKIVTPEGLIKKDVNDYDNVIFNIIKKADLDEIFMAIDYQRYFNPFLPIASEIKFASFIQAANSFNETKYPEWINKNYTEAIDVKQK
ncbi:MAG TPA: hypothetical protein DC057_08555 [Spirochaetia bacterium]|nr:hypothetical protein [Spirochaetia bacterium]